jgi:hypothetical protein
MIIVRFNSFVQINSSCWIRKSDYFEEVKGTQIKIKGFEEFDLILHKVSKGNLNLWQITEAISGAKLTKLFKSPKKAIESADAILSTNGSSRAEFKIRELVNHKMLSPRYRFVVNPNSIIYVATKQDKNSKSVLSRRYRVQVLEE